ADEGPHLDRDCTPAVDGAQPRPHPGVRSRRDCRAGHSRCIDDAAERHLPFAVRAAGHGVCANLGGGVGRSGIRRSEMTEAGTKAPDTSWLRAIGAARHDPAARLQNVDLLAILIAILLPWSTSGVGIAVALWVVALIPT